jgi:hypothetical protein
MTVATAMTIAMTISMPMAITMPIAIAVAPATAVTPAATMAPAAAAPPETIEMAGPEKCRPAERGAAIRYRASRTRGRPVRKRGGRDQDDDCGGQNRRGATSKSYFHGDTPDIVRAGSSRSRRPLRAQQASSPNSEGGCVYLCLASRSISVAAWLQ